MLAHLRRVVGRTSSAVAIVAVLAAYAFFASIGTFAFRRVGWQRDTPKLQYTERYYAALAEGFLHGRLSLPYEPDARWQNVNPYDQKSREPAGLAWEMWDATLYRGHFYLYFSPVPVVFFYIPFRLIAGAYPPDNLIAAVAASWAFLMSVALARRAIGERSRVPFAIWILLIGLGNVIPFTFSFLRTYEVASTTGMAMTASWAYMLVRWRASGRLRDAIWMNAFLGLAIATRPNLFVLLPIALLGRQAPPPVGSLARGKRLDWRGRLTSMIPLAVTGGLVALYNFLRFGNPLEFGMTYQISYEPIWRHAPCSLCDVPTLMRFMNNVQHYVFWPPMYVSEFPFVRMLRSHLEASLSFSSGSEQIIGVAALSPLVLIGSAIALVFALRRGEGEPVLAVMAGAWLILAGLSTCRWVTARYSLDFMMLMTAGSAVLIERVLALIDDRRVAAIVVLIALVTIGVSVFLGFSGPDDAFAAKWSALHG